MKVYKFLTKVEGESVNESLKNLIGIPLNPECVTKDVISIEEHPLGFFFCYYNEIIEPFLGMPEEVEDF